jgi:ApaG protein
MRGESEKPTAVTDGIRVTVEATYVAEQSAPEDGRYAFAYAVTIANEGETTVQLRRRHWIITDGNGKVEEVEGPGVVGEQPTLEPGKAHRYRSGAILPTPVGTMEGTYQMHEAGGRVFEARIPRFPLHVPGVLH